MKPQIILSARVRQFTLNLSKLLTIIVCFILLYTESNAQSYSKFYNPANIDMEFPNHEAYVIQYFRPTTTYPNGATIKVQSVYNVSSVDDPIQITLVDQDGQTLYAFFVFEGLDGTFTPTCAAYNSITMQYCIAGINEGNTTLTNTQNASWFLFLDADLNVIDAQMCGVDLSPTTGPNMNLYVSDITSVEGTASLGLGDFAYVGVAGTAMDPSPTNNTTSTLKEMYIGYASVGAMGPTRAFDFGIAANDAYFPSRWIEIPMSGGNGGFMISGIGTINSGGYGSLFFSRTDYSLNFSGTTDMYTSLTLNIGLSSGDLFFDKLTDKIWFAGTGLGSLDIGGTCLIFNKIVDLNLPGVTLYAGTASNSIGNPAFGRMILFDIGIPKIAKIMLTQDATIGAIASNFYENNFYANNTKTFPMLSKIDFDDTPLDDFAIPGTQPIDIYTYTRIYGNNGLGNLPYLSYNNNWYPSHNAHFMPANNESYILGGTTFAPFIPPTGSEYLVLNRTENYFENDCDFKQEFNVVDYIEYSVYSLTPVNGTDALLTYTPSQAITPINVTYNDCIDNIAFKGNILIDTDPLSVMIKQSNLIIKSSSEAKFYKLYNANGSLVLKGYIYEGSAMSNIEFVSNGMYFIEVLDSHNNRISTEKFIK